MILKKIKLVNYRNLVKQEVNFSKNINIFIGDNAQGKTNLLESIYFLALTKSYRTNDLNLINKDSMSSKVKGDIKKDLIKDSQEISKEEIADKNPYKRDNILRRLSDSKKLNNNSSINTDNEKNYYKKNIKI